MDINHLSIAELKLILDEPVDGKELVLLTINELIVSKAIALKKGENPLFIQAEKFNTFKTGSYAPIHDIVYNYYKHLNDPDKLKEPLLSPQRLIDKVYAKCNRNFNNYKKLIKDQLASKRLMKRNYWFWNNYILTQQGKNVKDTITDELDNFEVALQAWKLNGNQENDNELKEIVQRLDLRLMLSNQVNKETLKDLKQTFNNKTHINSFDTILILDALHYLDYEFFKLDFRYFRHF